MVGLSFLGALGLSLSGICSAAVVDGRESDMLDDAAFASPADDVAPFRLSARNKITSKVEEIPGGINVNWTDAVNMTAKRQCIVGEHPAYFAVSDIGYFARDACNTVMNGHHGKGEESQIPGTYRYTSPAYIQEGEGQPKVAVLVTLKLSGSKLSRDAPFSCVNMLAHFYDTSGAGWCVTNTDKHTMMTQGGKIQVKTRPVDGTKSWGEFFHLTEPDTFLELKLDPAKCDEDGDPCDNKHQVADSAMNAVMEQLPIGAQQYFNAGSTGENEVEGDDTEEGGDESGNHDELKS
ncbi:MAG: hypothetical protein Q9210_000529 [Variospora velana]